MIPYGCGNVFFGREMHHEHGELEQEKSKERTSGGRRERERSFGKGKKNKLEDSEEFLLPAGIYEVEYEFTAGRRSVHL